MTQWLTDEQQQAWRKFAGVFTLLPAALDAQLQRDEDLTHFAYWVMAMLSETGSRRLQMSDLAAMSSSSLSRLSHTVARLERRHWVLRERSPDNPRATVALLTDAGYAKVVQAAPGHVATVRALVFDPLTKEQVAELEAICSAMLERLNPDHRLTAYHATSSG